MPICDETDAPFLPGEYGILIARHAWERAGHFALRREVFCREMRLFEASDRDPIDHAATPIVATTTILGSPHSVVGTVRIHEEENPGHWRGSRLAVHADHRRIGALGTALIRLAVCTAHARGAVLHWTTLEESVLHGLPHHLMQVDLSRYPPHGLDGDRLFRPVGADTRRAA
jgi:putative N-acetyltransferase (TIGR04045 family)